MLYRWSEDLSDKVFDYVSNLGIFLYCAFVISIVAISFSVFLSGCSVFTSSDDDDDHRDLTPYVFWMPADVWQHFRGTTMVKYAIDAKLNIGIEWPPSVHGNRDRNDPNPLPTYPAHGKAWNKEICDAGGKMIVFLLNMNQRYAKDQSIEFFRQMAREAKANLDPRCTWIEPTVEPHDEGHRPTNEAKYAAVAAEMADFKMIMPASCGSNGNVNPVFPNQRHDFLDCHPSDFNQAKHWLGPSFDAHKDRLIVITDGGDLINNIPTKLSQYTDLAQYAKNRGRLISFYTDRYAPGDEAAHRQVIDAIGAGVK